MFDDITELVRVAGSVLKKAICIFDDIPFLLKGVGELTGIFTLIGAGYLIFGLQLYDEIKALRKIIDENKDQDDKELGPLQRAALMANCFAKIGCAIAGLIFTTGLLVTTATALVILAVSVSSALILTAKLLLLIVSTVSVVIPYLMCGVAGIELIEAIDAWKFAEDAEKKEQAAISILYNVAYLGLAMAVAALATITVIIGPGIATYVLIGVIGVSVALKLYEEREAIRDAFSKIISKIKAACYKKEEPDSSPDLVEFPTSTAQIGNIVPLENVIERAPPVLVTPVIPIEHREFVKTWNDDEYQEERVFSLK